MRDLIQRDPVWQRYLRALRLTGTRAAACEIADISDDTIERWCKQDPTLREQDQAARRACGERVVSRMVGAALAATDEQLINHPTGAIAVANWLLPELRPNAAPAQVAVQVNILDRLQPDQRSRIAAALYEED